MFESKINRGKANGYAPLDGSGKVPLDKLPPIQSTINTGSFVTTAQTGSFITDNQTGSFATTSSLQTLVDATGSFATTGSNIFFGEQTVSGSLLLAGNIGGALALVDNVEIFTSQINFVPNSSGEPGSNLSTIQLVPDVNSPSADQMLIIDPTGGFPNHIHLRPGGEMDNSSTSIILGGESSNVSVVGGENPPVQITSNNYVWQFDTDGTITFPDNSVQTTAFTGINSSSFATTGSNTFRGNQTISGSLTFASSSTIELTSELSILTPSAGVPNSLSNWNGQGGWNESSYINLTTTGGTGTGLTVDVAAEGAGYIAIEAITINTPGSGYTNGDVITIDNENNLPGTFTIGIEEGSGWVFDSDGILKLNNGIGEVYADPNDYSVRIGTAGENIAPNTQIIIGGPDTIFKVKAGPPLREWDFALNGDFNLTGSINGASNLATTGSNTFRGTTTFETVGGDEGGEIQFGIPQTNTTLQNRVNVDVWQNRLRIFEGSVNSKGVFVDLSKAPNAVGGELMWKASGFVNLDTDVTLGNLKARIPTSGNRSLQLSTISGTYAVYGSDVYSFNGIGGGTLTSPVTVTTTPTYLNAGHNFTIAGATDTWNIMDTSAGIAWRITMIIGASYINNFISIERLH